MIQDHALTLGDLRDRVDAAILDLGRTAPVRVTESHVAPVDSAAVISHAGPLEREFLVVVHKP